MNISKKYILSGVIATSVAIPLSSAISNADTIEYRTITANSVNFRTGPGTNYSSMKKLNKGDTVEYISTSGTWVNVKYNGQTGYVHSDYVSSSSSSTQTTTKIVTATTLNVRSGAGTNYSKITTISYGTEVGVISESNGWSKINYNGKTGYVSSQYLSNKSEGSTDSSTTSSKVDKLISFAKTLLGKDYSWGAEGPNSFDCSGFTYYVFKQSAGITIPRVSKDQSKYGAYVSRSNVQKGDLVFFDTDGSNDGNVSHVGIYIGNGQFIHASSSKDEVVISDFNSNYYTNAFVNARRVL